MSQQKWSNCQRNCFVFFMRLNNRKDFSVKKIRKITILTCVSLHNLTMKIDNGKNLCILNDALDFLRVISITQPPLPNVPPPQSYTSFIASNLISRIMHALNVLQCLSLTQFLKFLIVLTDLISSVQNWLFNQAKNCWTIKFKYIYLIISYLDYTAAPIRSDELASKHSHSRGQSLLANARRLLNKNNHLIFI